jgi:hypothetical protein
MRSSHSLPRWLTAAAALVVLPAAVACGDDETDGGGGQAPNPSARTLDSCATDIASDVPDFYRTYFRCADIAMSGGDVVIHTIDLPPHPSAYYPEGDPNHTAFDTSGGAMQIPGTLEQQDITVVIPTDPVAKGIVVEPAFVDGILMTHDDELPGGAAGVALDGVAFFSGAAGMGMSVANEADTFDSYGAHHAMGMYHYHGQTPGPLEVLERAGIVDDTTPGAAAVELYAVMCDGTLVLGCTELDGSAPTTADLDAQGGHVHDIADGEATYFTARYHTHVCPGAGADFSPEIQYYTACP